MRYSRAFVPQLDFVAVFDDKIVGNIVFLKSVIQADTGKEYEVLSLGPISVLPEYQNMGLGNRLIDHTRNLAKCMGFRAILLCGDPDYYLRRGFVPAETLGIRTADDMYADALHVCELYENALSDARGRYIENPNLRFFYRFRKNYKTNTVIIYFKTTIIPNQAFLRMATIRSKRF